jgi:hypothetical protein
MSTISKRLSEKSSRSRWIRPRHLGRRTKRISQVFLILMMLLKWSHSLNGEADESSEDGEEESTGATAWAGSQGARTRSAAT